MLGLLSLALFYPSLVSGGHGWNYNLEDHSGPSHWSSIYPSCSGVKQSPVDLKGGRAVHLPPLVLQHYDELPGKADLRNNGHTAKLSTKPTGSQLTPTMSGGGLQHKYKFSQVHFHWGAENGKGSEHQVEGVSYPMEMHLVHFKASLPTIMDALEEGAADSLAVLGIFFEVSETPNKGLADLVTSFKEVSKAGNETTTTLFPISNFWSDVGDLTSFYRYEGSLTTPSCNEIVQWTVLRNPVKISQDQLDMFRSLKDKDSESLVDNFRPVQAIGEREILEVTTEEEVVKVTAQKKVLEVFIPLEDSAGVALNAGNLVILSLFLLHLIIHSF